MTMTTEQFTNMQNVLSRFDRYTVDTVIRWSTAGLIACWAILISMLLYQCHKSVKNPERNKKPHMLTCIASILLFTAAMFTTITQLSATDLKWYAGQFGFDKSKTMAIRDIYPELEALPMESELPDDLRDCAVIYYRFGCPDCKAVHKDLYDQLKIYKNVYYVYTRSETGMELKKTYPVEKVPSAVYIDGNGKTYTCVLYHKKDGKAELDWEKLNELLNFINKESRNENATGNRSITDE